MIQIAQTPNSPMLLSIYVAFLSFLIGLLFYFTLLRWRSPAPGKVHQKLPPGPRGLPIIGNLHMLGTLPHRTLYHLAQNYGPIMFLKLGNIPTVVVSSPETAELILKTHDAVFASRPKLKAISYISDGSKGLAFAPYGPQWRNARKFCTQELLTAVKIGSYAGMRKEEIGVLVEQLKAVGGGVVVDVGEKIGDLIGNMTYRMLFGDRNNSERFDLKSIVVEMVRLAGTFNIADYVPFLEPFDIQGLNKQMKKTGKAVQEIIDTIINEHEQDARNHTHKTNKDLVDIILSYQKDGSKSYSIDRATMKAILADMIVGAIDTSYTWIEWVFAEIIKHPNVMYRLQDELTSIVGLNRMVEEEDLPKLEYLELVLKETFRLHPVATLLVPRESMEDVVISEYYIPRGSRVMINCWALGHDPKIWSENVEEFVPERFISKNIDLRVRDFHLLPFGYGRRSCPGINLGLIIVKLIVAQLVHCFNWDLPDGMLPADLDMTEKFGLAAPRAHNLLIIPTYRLLS